MKAKSTTALVNKIIKRHGPVIDLRKDPQTIIDIMVRFADDIPDGGTPCGGVPPTPPTGPSKIGTEVTLDDLMKVVTQLSRDVDAIGKAVKSKR